MFKLDSTCIGSHEGERRVRGSGPEEQSQVTDVERSQTQSLDNGSEEMDTLTHTLTEKSLSDYPDTVISFDYSESSKKFQSKSSQSSQQTSQKPPQPPLKVSRAPTVGREKRNKVCLPDNAMWYPIDHPLLDTCLEQTIPIEICRTR